MNLEIKYANPRIIKRLDRYPLKQKEKILNAIENKLKQLTPFTKGIRKIKTKSKDLYRLKIKDFRIIYKREKNIIWIMNIKPRKDVYRGY